MLLVSTYRPYGTKDKRTSHIYKHSVPTGLKRISASENSLSLHLWGRAQRNPTLIQIVRIMSGFAALYPTYKLGVDTAIGFIF